jgi:hypothetical protein
MMDENQTALSRGEQVRDGGIGDKAIADRRALSRHATGKRGWSFPACMVAPGERGSLMRQVVGLFVVCLGLALPQSSSAGDLPMGMSEREVVARLGPPDAVRLERNGVVCLTYEQQQHRVWLRLFGERTLVIALKDNHLVDDDTVRTREVRFHCSHVAARWDPPMREPLISCAGRCP